MNLDFNLKKPDDGRSISRNVAKKTLFSRHDRLRKQCKHIPDLNQFRQQNERCPSRQSPSEFTVPSVRSAEF